MGDLFSFWGGMGGWRVTYWRIGFGAAAAGADLAHASDTALDRLRFFNGMMASVGIPEHDPVPTLQVVGAFPPLCWSRRCSRKGGG